MTRRVCGAYSEAACRRLYRGAPGGLCDDGCNRCFCTAHGLASTEMACLPYDHRDCLARHGEGLWDCEGGRCACTGCGVGFEI
ncbi:hypothetical protein CDD83_9043 [Cordyceps sp. RAO-2017]|nr:hypothetical protein CDD83_9043 [Cordyceps sp. RAO-2017]